MVVVEDVMPVEVMHTAGGRHPGRSPWCRRGHHPARGRGAARGRRAGEVVPVAEPEFVVPRSWWHPSRDPPGTEPNVSFIPAGICLTFRPLTRPPRSPGPAGSRPWRRGCSGRRPTPTPTGRRPSRRSWRPMPARSPRPRLGREVLAQCLGAGAAAELVHPVRQLLAGRGGVEDRFRTAWSPADPRPSRPGVWRHGGGGVLARAGEKDPILEG